MKKDELSEINLRLSILRGELERAERAEDKAFAAYNSARIAKEEIGLQITELARKKQELETPGNE